MTKTTQAPKKKPAKTSALPLKKAAPLPSRATFLDPERLSKADSDRLAAWTERRRKHKVVEFITVGKGDDASAQFCDQEPMDIMALVGLVEATGVSDHRLASRMVSQAAGTFVSENPADRHNLALSALHEFLPQDILEGQLVSQMTAVHNLTMRFLNNATSTTDSEVVGRNVDYATKLMRTHTAQIEALTRYRGKGQQKMTIEHVTVQSGGQAIVGNVTTSAPTALPGGLQSPHLLDAGTDTPAPLPSPQPVVSPHLRANMEEAVGHQRGSV